MEGYLVFIPVAGKHVREPCSPDEVYEKVVKYLGNITTDTFYGKYEGVRGIFFADDLGYSKNLPMNKDATEAYLKCCRPGTTHVIVGNVVGLFGEAAE